MRKKIILFSFGLLFSTEALANNNCFITKENNQIITESQSINACTTRHSPFSTFKIAISLMGYNEGILTDETHPEYLFKAGYPSDIEAWKQMHNPTLWIRNSCVWYSQIITQKLKIFKLQNYVNKFDYGNKDVSGRDAVTNAWLSGSIKISPFEQIEFLQKLLANKLPVKHSAHQMTKNILFTQNLPNGWKLYGKTGGGNVLNKNGSKSDVQIGWFVGWIQKDNRVILFANYFEDKNEKDLQQSKRAKMDAQEKLLKLVGANIKTENN